MQQAPLPAPAAKLRRRPVVSAETGLTRSSLYALMAKGEFPKPVRISARAVAWVGVEVDHWIETRAKSGSCEASR